MLLIALEKVAQETMHIRIRRRPILHLLIVLTNLTNKRPCTLTVQMLHACLRNQLQIINR